MYIFIWIYTIKTRSPYPDDDDVNEDYGDSDDGNSMQGILKRSSVNTSQKSVRTRKIDGTGIMGSA
jgi:hypothetical protein